MLDKSIERGLRATSPGIAATSHCKPPVQERVCRRPSLWFEGSELIQSKQEHEDVSSSPQILCCSNAGEFARTGRGFQRLVNASEALGVRLRVIGKMPKSQRSECTHSNEQNAAQHHELGIKQQ